MKILMVSNSPLIPTGFSKVAHNIAMYLSKEHKVFYQGKMLFHIPLNFHGYHLLQGGHTLDGTSAQLLKIYLTKIKPDILLTLEDARSLSYLPDVLNEMKFKGKWLFYYPLDMEYEAPWHIELMTGILRDGKPSNKRIPDVVICMSDFAYKLVKKWKVRRVEKIYHGVDTKIFKPMKKDFTLFKALKLEKYKHIIGYVSNNQFRKMPYKTLFAFKEVNKKLKNVCLLMHTPEKMGVPTSPMYSIKGTMNAFNIKNVIVNPVAAMHLKAGVNEPYMAKLYNLFDCHLLLSGGEGFGVTILESMACSKPNILTDWTTSSQMIGNNERGFLVKVKDKAVGFNVEYRACADEKEASNKIIRLLKNDNLRNKMGKNARKFALRFSWPKVLKKWTKLMNSL